MKGFMDGYTRWTSHGEEAEVGASTFEEESIQHEETEEDNEENLVREDNLTEMLHDVHMAERLFKTLRMKERLPSLRNC
jgi:hypothetical protein